MYITKGLSRMRWGFRALVLVGILVAGLGALWLLQGSGVVHLDPILCVANCAPVTGYHPEWQVTGAIALALGAGAIVVGARRSMPARRDG